MRKVTIDYSKGKVSGLINNKYAGYLGEHNATEIVVVKPVDLSGDMYSVAFMTNGEVIHSKFFGADEEIRVALWQQLTQDNDLYVQLEAYDENGDYLGKSATVKLLLLNSVHGIDVIADADNPDVYSEIALNSLLRETLEDNVDTLDKLTTSNDGKLLFDGKPLGAGGIKTEEDPTVPAWAKQPEPPVYTAEDVGALPADTVIPSSEDIKAEVELALENAKANGEFKGEKGEDGKNGLDGIDGKSAYQYAVDGGFEGSEKEFTSLLGNVSSSSSSERPTDTVELGDNTYIVSTNATQGALICSWGSEIAEGTEIKSIEIYTDEYGWLDIRALAIVDVEHNFYVPSIYKAYIELTDNVLCYGGFMAFSHNVFGTMAGNNQITNARITYYIDGGVNNE